MDRRRSAKSNTSPSSTPSLQDKDAAMGPPPPPVPSPASSSQRKELAEVVEKYNKLKRRYAELEEKHKETSTELRRSGRRNVKMRQEQVVLVDRIIELESQVEHPQSIGVPTPPDSYSPPSPSALPRSLASSRAQSSFVSNLRAAVVETEMDDDTDPIFSSRHLGPLARQRAEEEERERREEEAKEAKRSTRRTRQSNTSRDMRVSTTPAMSFPPSHSSASDAPPTLVTSGGMRLRIRPPAPPISEAGPSNASPNGASASSSSSRGPSHPPSVSMDGRSQSPSSPSRSSPKEEHGFSHYNSQLGHPPPPNNNYAPSPYYRDHGASSGPSSPVNYRGASAKSGSQGNIMTSPTSHLARAAAPPLPPPHPLSPPLQHSHHSSSLSGPGNGSSPSRPSEIQRHAKPKRLKAHTVTTKSYSIPMVPRDRSGKPMLPLNVGIMTVICLGDVCMREHFHTERYIFPVGYEVTRRYHSTVDPNAEVVYHCTILDGGDGPKFQIVPSDTPDQPVIAGTATGAWSTIVKKANAIRNRQHSNSVSGPDFFGLGQNTIKHLIQELPCADRLKDYVWQNFVEGGPLGGRHAAVIPALPEEYDATLPIGSYYPDRRQPPSIPLPQSSPQSHSPPQQHQSPHASHQSLSAGHSQQHSILTQIVLPPPTTSDTLTIQEYHPPPPKDSSTSERRSTRASSRRTSHSPPPSGAARAQHSYNTHKRTPSSASTGASAHPHSRRGSSVSSASSTQHPSPYVANAPHSTSSTPPAVPATFASIMNAYPAASPTPLPPSQNTPPAVRSDDAMSD